MAKALAGKRVRAALACATALTLAACSEEPSFDVASQIGPNPNLPPIQQYLFPPMHLARVVGWKEGEKPTVADGLKIEALATGLQHPRSVYVLPNGDVLVVQSRQPWPDPIHRPKDLVMRWIESWVTSGGDTGPSNRITLLRDADGDGKAFVGEHGSWDRYQFNGYKVVFVPFSGGRPNGKAEDVVTGFLNANGEARGRPVGVAVDKTGALLIADDVGNTVWRVTSADQHVTSAGQ